MFRREYKCEMVCVCVDIFMKGSICNLYMGSNLSIEMLELQKETQNEYSVFGKEKTHSI